MGVCGSAEGKGQTVSQKRRTQQKQMTPLEKALLDCKVCRDKIKDLIKRVEKTSIAKKNKAKELLKSKQKERALLYLRQSKFHSEQVNVYEGQLNMVEEQIMSIENTQVLADAQKVLEKGNIALKKLQSEIQIEKWEQIRDDMEEMKESQSEMQQFFEQYQIDVESYENGVEEDMKKLENEVGTVNEQLFPNANQEDVYVQNICLFIISCFIVIETERLHFEWSLCLTNGALSDKLYHDVSTRVS